VVRQPCLPPRAAVVLRCSRNIHEAPFSRAETGHFRQETARTSSLMCRVKEHIPGSVSELPVSFHRWNISVLGKLSRKMPNKTKGSCQLCRRAAFRLCLRWDWSTLPLRTAVCLHALLQCCVSAPRHSRQNACRTPSKLPRKSYHLA